MSHRNPSIGRLCRTPMVSFALGLLGLAVLGGCARRAPADQPGAVVVIVIDTLRGDRLGCTGYPQARTPNLDALAAGGTLFTQAMTAVPVTLPSIATLFTGRLPFHHGVRDNDYCVLPPEEVTLAERLQDAGWKTGAVVASAVIARDRGLDQGFDTYDDAFSGPYPVYQASQQGLAEGFARTRRRADTVTDLALQRLEAFGDDRFFLFVHYFDVHMHYDPPPAYAAAHPGRPYDGEVSFVDHEIGRLLEGLADRPDALVLVVSDHGESQNEHGEPQHGFLLYESTLHVPVLVAGPGVPRNLVRDDPISLVDLEPTLAEALALPGDFDRDGRPLRWDLPAAEPAPLYAETFRPLVSYEWAPLRALRLGDLKLIEGPWTEVYDVGEDSAELNDLGETRDVKVLRDHLEVLTRHDDPEAVFAELRGRVDPGRRELLESLGYLAGGSSEATPHSRPHPRDMLPLWIEEQVAKELFRIAVTRVESGALREGIAMLDSVLVLRPTDADAWFVRGHARASLSDEAGAMADFQHALDVRPDHVSTLVALARHAAAGGNMIEAERFWTRVALAQPDHDEALRFLATRYLEAGEPEAALPWLRRLAAEHPEDPAVRYNLGVAARQAGHVEEARRQLETYRRLDPEGAEERGIDADF